MDAPDTKIEAESGSDAPSPVRDSLAARHARPRDDPGREARWAAWQAEHADAIAASNAWVEEHGLPLARYRMF